MLTDNKNNQSVFFNYNKKSNIFDFLVNEGINSIFKGMQIESSINIKRKNKIYKIVDQRIVYDKNNSETYMIFHINNSEPIKIEITTIIDFFLNGLMESFEDRDAMDMILMVQSFLGNVPGFIPHTNSSVQINSEPFPQQNTRTNTVRFSQAVEQPNSCERTTVSQTKQDKTFNASAVRQAKLDDAATPHRLCSKKHGDHRKHNSNFELNNTLEQSEQPEQKDDTLNSTINSHKTSCEVLPEKSEPKIKPIPETKFVPETKTANENKTVLDIKSIIDNLPEDSELSKIIKSNLDSIEKIKKIIQFEEGREFIKKMAKTDSNTIVATVERMIKTSFGQTMIRKMISRHLPDF